MTGKRMGLWLLTGAVAGILLVTPAVATNGMYLAGYGAEAAGRGGANIAIADRALGLQSNPAGIAQLQGNHLSVDFQFLMPELHYSGPYGDFGGEDRVFAMPSISYVRGGAESHWTWGIGFVSQGGMGATFNGYNTPFGTTDDTYSQVRFATLVPTVAYSFSDDVSLGLSVNVGYSDVAFDFWPNTSAPPAFAGMEMTDPAKAFNYSFRGGLMFRVHPALQFGIIYQTETKGDYEDGTLVLNYPDPPFGRVVYDADVSGFTWPEQFGIGMQLRPTQRLMLAIDLKEYLWSESLGEIGVTASNPDNPMAPANPQLPPFVFNWKDQLVAIFGLEYRVNDDVTIRAGYNHGDSPVPDATLTPLFPAIVEDHATLGLGWNIQSWTINAAIERGFEASQTNSNTPASMDPWAGSSVAHSQWTFSMGFTKAFARKKAKGGQ